jgi:hypothetical protein
MMHAALRFEPFRNASGEQGGASHVFEEAYREIAELLELIPKQAADAAVAA